MRMPGARRVTIIKHFGSGNEKRIPVMANIQPERGFFAANADIREGDVVELRDPRGEVQHLPVQEVKIWDQGSAADHIEVRWGRPAEIRQAAIQRLGLEGLHAEILVAVSNLYTDGHYPQAIFEAFKAVEMRVREMTGIDASGRDLMSRAFRADTPTIHVTQEQGQTARDEQEGFMFLFMGAMQGIRNPKAHAQVVQQDPQRTLEYLAFASLLMRRLDDAAGGQHD